MPDQPQFDDIPLIAEFGATLRSAMVAAEAAEVAAAPAPTEQAKKKPWWKSFRLFGTVLVLGLVGTGATAATLTILRGSPIPAPKSADLGRAMTARASTQRVLPIRAADPSGTLPAFALRTGKSLDGQTCVTVGEVDHRKFGLVGTDRTFRALAPTFVDACGAVTGNDAAVAGARVLDAKSYDDVRSVVYVVGGPTLRTARLLARGRWRTLTVAQGAAISAVKGYPEDSGLALELGFAGGKKVTHDIGRQPGTFLDPDGPAWSARLMSRARNGRGGKPCVSVGAARVVPTMSLTAPAQAHTPVLCDSPLPEGQMTRLSAGILDPYVFTTRTFQPGDSGGSPRDWTQWTWHDVPARTIIWGMIDRVRVRSIKITAPGQPTTTYAAQAISAFAAIYPASVPASAVRVTVTMRGGKIRHLGSEAGDHRTDTP